MRFVLFCLILFAAGCLSAVGQNLSLAVAGEKRITNIRQLTFGGENAEA